LAFFENVNTSANSLLACWISICFGEMNGDLKGKFHFTLLFRLPIDTKRINNEKKFKPQKLEHIQVNILPIKDLTLSTNPPASPIGIGN